MSWVLEVVFLGCPQSGAQGTALLIQGELQSFCGSKNGGARPYGVDVLNPRMVYAF